jgi:hypothetical protein
MKWRTEGIFMTTTLLSQLGIIPALLILLTGVIILRGNDKEKGTRRFLLFLLGTGVLCQLALFIIKRFATEPYNQPFFQATWLLAPSLLGILALILLNGRKALAGLNRGNRGLTGTGNGDPVHPESGCSIEHGISGFARDVDPRNRVGGRTSVWLARNDIGIVLSCWAFFEQLVDEPSLRFQWWLAIPGSWNRLLARS